MCATTCVVLKEQEGDGETSVGEKISDSLKDNGQSLWQNGVGRGGGKKEGGRRMRKAGGRRKADRQAEKERVIFYCMIVWFTCLFSDSRVTSLMSSVAVRRWSGHQAQ